MAWVKLLYTDIRSAVLINGYVSETFPPFVGPVRGVPFRPCLTLSLTEVLAASLRAHPAIIGPRLPGIPSPLPTYSLYADDTSVISLSDVAILAVFDVYDTLERGTGFEVKSREMRGSLAGAVAQPG